MKMKDLVPAYPRFLANVAKSSRQLLTVEEWFSNVCLVPEHLASQTNSVFLPIELGFRLTTTSSQHEPQLHCWKLEMPTGSPAVRTDTLTGVMYHGDIVGCELDSYLRSEFQLSIAHLMDELLDIRLGDEPYPRDLAEEYTHLESLSILQPQVVAQPHRIVVACDVLMDARYNVALRGDNMYIQHAGTRNKTDAIEWLVQKEGNTAV